jgi:opacity protein-like surface antigen
VSYGYLDSEAEFSTLNLDLKYFIANEQQIQPYLLVGIAYSRLTVKDFSLGYDDFGDLIGGDANFNGFGYNLGGGLAIYLNPRVAISGGLIYRVLEYNTAEGASGRTREFQEPISAGGLNFNAGIILTF